MFFAVAICYALVLQGLLGSLAPAGPQESDASAYMTVICHSEAPDSGGSGAPAKDIAAKHHCILCQCGPAVPLLAAMDPVPAQTALERRAAVITYARRQDPATAPLYLPPRLSRGPPLAG